MNLLLGLFLFGGVYTGDTITTAVVSSLEPDTLSKVAWLIGANLLLGGLLYVFYLAARQTEEDGEGSLSGREPMSWVVGPSLSYAVGLGAGIYMALSM